MVDLPLKAGVPYVLRNGIIIDGVTQCDLAITEENPTYVWRCAGPAGYEHMTYDEMGRVYATRESPGDIVDVATLRHNPHFDTVDAEMMISTNLNINLRTIAEIECDTESYKAFADATTQPQTVTIQLVQADGVTFEADVPMSLVADVGVITYYGSLFVYQHSTVFRRKPRFVEQQNAILNTIVFAQVSE